MEEQGAQEDRRCRRTRDAQGQQGRQGAGVTTGCWPPLRRGDPVDGSLAELFGAARPADCFIVGEGDLAILPPAPGMMPTMVPTRLDRRRSPGFRVSSFTTSRVIPGLGEKGADMLCSRGILQPSPKT